MGKPISEVETEWQERYDYFWQTDEDISTQKWLAFPDTVAYEKIKDLIRKELTEAVTKAREEMVEDFLKLLDELEIDQPEYARTDSWRNWKYIRNSVRERYSPQQEEEHV